MGVCDKMVQEMFERAKLVTGMERKDYHTWTTHVYRGSGKLGFIDLWHVPTYYEIRQDPKIYSIYAQLYRNHDLTICLDRVSMKPPAFVQVGKDASEKIYFPELHGFFQVHNDMNLWYLNEFKYQASVCLSDCPEGSGGFYCIPGFHKLNRIREYRIKYEKGSFTGEGSRDPPDPYSYYNLFYDLETIDKCAKEVPMEQGDFVIWSSRLPHASASNTSDRWRLQCYVNCIENKEWNQFIRQDHAKAVKTGNMPEYFSSGNTTGSSLTWEAPLHTPPELTWLGKRALGLEVFTEDRLENYKKTPFKVNDNWCYYYYALSGPKKFG